MGVVGKPAGVRRGLVAPGARAPGPPGLIPLGRVLLCLAFLYLGLPGFPQSGGPGGPGEGALSAGGFALVGAEQVLASRCTRIHENPLHLLFLLPGVLFLLFAAAVRRRKGLLALLVAGAVGAGAWVALGPGTAVLVAADAPPPAETLLLKAERSFAAGRRKEALALYREAAELLPCNPALEHNLGVCYAETGETGYAVLHLRRSLQTRPSDRATRRALASVERSAGLEGQLPMPVPVNPDVLFVATLVLANLSLGAAGFALRRKGVRALIALILLTISAGISLGFFLGILQGENRPEGVVIAREVGLLKIPEQGARTSFVLPPGTSLGIRGQVGEYYLVETASRYRGWVRADAILLD